MCPQRLTVDGMASGGFKMFCAGWRMEAWPSAPRARRKRAVKLGRNHRRRRVNGQTQDKAAEAGELGRAFAQAQLLTHWPSVGCPWTRRSVSEQPGRRACKPLTTQVSKPGAAAGTGATPFRRAPGPQGPSGRRRRARQRWPRQRVGRKVMPRPKANWTCEQTASDA